MSLPTKTGRPDGWPVGRSARRLDRYGVGRARDDRGIVGGQVRAARRVADHAERTWRAEFRVDDPEFVRFARRGLRRDRANRELLLVEIDRDFDGRRSRVLLQDRHIFACGPIAASPRARRTRSPARRRERSGDRRSCASA